ncbi:MAG: hypothetical protein NTY77_04590 [Elusimicrobia bacterium]|nr:hypothetical protein [Elusimicrobiota bacterium]
MGRWASGWIVAASLLALLARGLAADEVECPEGTERIHTDNPYDPFQCVNKGDRRKGGLSPALGPTGFTAKPRCPPGSRPVMTPTSLQPYRCVMSSRTPAEPDMTPDLDTAGRTRSWAVPPESAQRGGAPGGRLSGPRGLTERSFTRYAISGGLSFDYPKDWHLTEAWTDEPPTIYVVYDTGGGKQVTMTLTAAEPGQAGYQSLDLAILMEKEWQNAALDKNEGRVAGLRTKFATVPGASRSAYVDRGGGRYLTLNYSAPGELYEFYLPAFQRLLKSLRLSPR